MSRLAEIVAELTSLRERRSKLMKEMFEIQVDLHPLSVGNDIKLIRTGVKGRVTEFYRSFSSVVPIITLYKKDGTLGKRRLKLYRTDEYELI